MTNKLDEIAQRNRKGRTIIVIAAVVAGLVALLFFRCYTA